MGAMGTPGKDSAGGGVSPYRSGSRLELRWKVDRYEDGTQTTNGTSADPLIFDKKLSIYCQPYQTPDRVSRCVPWPNGSPDSETATIDAYADSRCTQRISWRHSAWKPPRYATVTNESFAQVYEAGEALPPPAKVYGPLPACSAQTAITEYRTYYRVGRELPAGDFVPSQGVIAN